MTYASIEAIYTGIAAQLDANDSSSISLAELALNLVPTYLKKRENCLALIQSDVQNYLLASLDFADDAAPAECAMWNEKKSVDTSSMNTQTGALNGLIENTKSQARVDETAMQNVISLQDPISEYLKSILRVTASIR